MECKWNSCKNEARVRSPFCSGTCKKRAQRHAEQTSGTFVPVEVGHALSGTQVGQLRDKVTGGMSHETLIKIDTACGDNISGQPDVPSEQDLLNEVCPPNPEIDPDKDYSYLDGPANLEDYHDETHGRRYSPRAEPDKLNWGEWMDMGELKKAGFKANRVSIPGDWDYAAVV